MPIVEREIMFAFTRSVLSNLVQSQGLILKNLSKKSTWGTSRWRRANCSQKGVYFDGLLYEIKFIAVVGYARELEVDRNLCVRVSYDLRVCEGVETTLGRRLVVADEHLAAVGRRTFHGHNRRAVCCIVLTFVVDELRRKVESNARDDRPALKDCLQPPRI